MYKSVISFSLTVFLMFLISCNPYKEMVYEYAPNKSEAFTEDTLIYYGVDFSRAVLTNPEKVNQEEALEKYFPAWIGKFEEVTSPRDEMSDWLAPKRFFKYEPGFQYEQINNQRSWITYENYQLPRDTLSRLISGYSLDRKKGTGFVIHVENMNKREEYLSAYFTFFDISTREILWTTKAKGEPGGFGMTNFWVNGLLNATENYKGVYEDKIDQIDPRSSNNQQEDPIY